MKKKLITALLILTGFVNCYAQDKNILLLGGDVITMFSSDNISGLSITSISPGSGGFAPANLMGTYGENSGDFKTLYLGLNPGISFYITEKLLIGMGLEVLTEQNWYHSELVTKSNTTSFLFSPLARYYIYRRFFGQVQYNTGKYKEKIISNSKPVPTATGFMIMDYSTVIEGVSNGFSLTAGYSIPLGSRILADLGLNYTFNKSKFEYANTSEKGKYTVNQNYSLVSFGFKYILKGKN